MMTLPDPLHPALVHLPIALAVLMPVVALGLALAIWRRLLPARTWIAVLLAQLVLVGAGWIALETGEDQEERIERVVDERHIEAHEESAERFESVAMIALVFIAAGLLPRTAGAAARAASVLAAAGVLAAGVAVGHSGGELVYRYGAANAYVDAQPWSGSAGQRPLEGWNDDD